MQHSSIIQSGKLSKAKYLSSRPQEIIQETCEHIYVYIYLCIYRKTQIPKAVTMPWTGTGKVWANALLYKEQLIKNSSPGNTFGRWKHTRRWNHDRELTLVRANLTRVTSPLNSTTCGPSLIFSILFSYLLFIFYIPWYTLPDFPPVSSLASLPLLPCCHQNNYVKHEILPPFYRLSVWCFSACIKREKIKGPL